VRPELVCANPDGARHSTPMTTLTDKLPRLVRETRGPSPNTLTRRWYEAVSMSARVRQFLLERFESDARPFVAIKNACYEELWTSAAAAVGARVDSLGYDVFRIARGGRDTFVSGSRVMLDGPVTLKMAGNKPLVSRLLREYGHPVGPFLEFDLSRMPLAEAFLRQLGGPAVVKPAISGASGKGVTIGISTLRELRRASILASIHSKSILIERQASGHSYRLLYMDGEFVDAVERRPPCVVGDGRHSMAELIRIENRRRRQGVSPLAMQPLSVDVELRRCLGCQGLALSSVAAAGRQVTLKAVVNENNAAENSTVRHRVHPDTIRRGADIARQLKIRLVGHDVMTTDISRPLEETGGVFNEVNTTPGLQHHYLIDNREQTAPVMERLLEILLDRKEWPR
jgi:cyanophycin synthetase